jgi:O-antigen/teichoic acid export membrane protein
LPLAAVALASLIFTQSGIIALEVFDGDAAVGIYNVAYSLYMPFIWFAMVLSKAVFPGQAELYLEDRNKAQLNYRQWYRLVSMAGIPIPIVTMMLAGPALSLLPETYEQSTTVLIILMWALPLTLIAAMQGNIMQMIGREMAQARLLIVGIVVILTLQVTLIPRYGVIGAPIAALSAAFVKEVMVYEEVRKTFFGGVHYLKLLLKPILGGIIMVVTTLLAWRLGPWIATSIGLAAYVATIFASGGVRLSELKALARR